MLDLFSYGASDEEDNDIVYGVKSGIDCRDSKPSSKDAKSTIIAAEEKQQNMDSLFPSLPKPKNEKRKRQRKSDNSDEEASVDAKKREEEDNSEEGPIPLNPFLDDAKALKVEEKNQENTVVYQTPHHEVKEVSVTTETTPVYGYASDNTYEVQGGYSGGYSQKQYEAFMRRSGMLASASAKTAKEANLLVDVTDDCDL